jgi:signal transduction histidine kinase
MTAASRPIRATAFDQFDARFRSLLEAAVAITSERLLPPLLLRVVGAARDVLDARYAALAVWENGQIAHFVHSGLDPATVERIDRLPSGDSLLGFVAEEQRPVRLADLTAHVRASGFPAHHPPMRSFLGVPVGSGSAVYGTLYLTEKIGASEFSNADETLAQGIAGLAAVAISNARFLARERDTIARLRALEQTRAAFTSMISHELRTPIATIRSAAILLRTREEEALAAPERASLAATIAREAESLAEFADRVLVASQIEAGEFDYAFIPYEPDELVGECVQSARSVHADRQFVIDGGRAPIVVGDPSRMRQALANLLSNACRYSEDGTAVTVKVSAEEATLRIGVVDRGIGVAPEDVPRLFERFARLAGGAHAPGGTGLGLYITREIAQAHGGTVGVESEPGAGSTFWIEVPRVATPPTG